MMTHVLWALQGAVEYGAATGRAVGATPRGGGPERLAAWATEHQMLLLAAAAGLLLLWMVRGALRR